MVITNKTSIEDLKAQYDVLIGWEVSRSEYIMKYSLCAYRLDYMIDMNKGWEGKTVCGLTVSGVDILKKFADSHVCIIVFPNIEEAVAYEASKYLKNYDMVVSALIDFGGQSFYSESGEDLLFMRLIERLGLKDPVYLDIGVCHPVIRNNTYMLYENGYRKGILVEPNPDMCKLIRKYRPDNTLLNMGACADESKSLKYFMSSNPSYVGHNTFSETAAKECGFKDYLEIPVDHINHIIKKYCGGVVDILDLDTEGMDLELISVLDTEKYGIKIICAEVAICGDDLIGKVLEEKGYVHFSSSRNNGIYLAKALLNSLK